jgi:hypothetical protein
VAATPEAEAILEEVGQVIRGEFGKGSPAQLIPHEDTKQLYPWAGAGPSWGDVYNWVKDRLVHDVGSIATAPSWQNVVFAVTAGLGRSIQAVSGFVNLAIDYTALVAEDLAHVARITFDEIAYVSSFLEDQITNLEHLTGGLANDLYRAIDQLRQQLQAEMLQGQAAVIAQVEAWAVANIAAPLYENLGQVYTGLTHYIDGKALEAIGAADAFTLQAIQPILASLAALEAGQAAQTAINAAQKALNDECTTPMCDTMGPKTDLGKWLKKLQFLATAALLAELAAMNADDIENLIRGLTRLGGGIIDDIDAIFTGGLNVGEALAQTGA